MELKKIHFKISDGASLDEKDKELLLESYRELFGQIYGFDIYDSLIKFTKKNKKMYNRLKEFSENYFKSQEMLEGLTEQHDISLLLIFAENILIGAGRIKVLDEETALVPDIAIGIGSEEEKRDIWKLAIQFIEEYLTEENFKKMYIEVPLTAPWLLMRADSLGFKEDPEDIVMDCETRTYLLNKDLERTRNAESNTINK